MSKIRQKESTAQCAQIREKRRNNVRYETLVEDYPLSLDTVLEHALGMCDCESDSEALDSLEDEPWRERFVVETLYLDYDLKFTEMADALDCHSETAKKYVDKFDVSPIDSSNRTSSRRVNKLQRLGAENDDISIKDD